MGRNISDNLVGVLRDSRKNSGISQKSMAESLHKSVSTIQSWEYGTSNPDFEDVVDWLRVCGLNPLRYYLEYLHPECFSGVGTVTKTADIRDAISKYFLDVAADSEVRKVAYCLFGDTGSSWEGQVDEMCALNHLPIKERIDIAELVKAKYKVAESTGRLHRPDLIQPDMENLQSSIDACYQAVADGKREYTNG